MSRHHDRDRSRDRHGYRGRSQSSDSYQKKKRPHHKTQHQANAQPASRRVKFNDVPDIKVFRKEDEPNSKGLTENDLQEFMKKMEAERGSSNFNSVNLERMKHIDAQLQNNSIKEQKQKQKILNEKLQGVKEEIQFYSPPLFKNNVQNTPGKESSERLALTDRLNDVLGCFYAQQSQIPTEPSFQIQNKSTSLQPKLINFDKQRIDNKDLSNNSKKIQKKEQKLLKGILKMTPQQRARQRAESEPRRIDPSLINLLRDIQINKSAYSKQKIESMLRPYKQSGQLDYIKNNPAILQNLMRSSSVPTQQVRSSVSPPGAVLHDPYKMRYSVSPQPQKPPIQPYPANGMHMQNQINKGMGIHPGYNNVSQFRPQQPQYPNYPPQYANQQFQGGYQMQQGQPQPIPPRVGVPYNTGNYGQAQNYPAQPGMQIPGQGNYPNFQMQPQQQLPVQNQQNPNQQQQQQGNSMYNNPNRNYKTVPCKYFHSPQGCVKATNCTFIHDQQYAGKPTPAMLKSNRGMVMGNYGPNDSAAMSGNFYPPFNGPYESQN